MFRVIVVVACSPLLLPAQATKPESNTKDNVVTVEEGGRLKCELPDGKPCTAADVKDVTVTGLKPITLRGAAGYISCESTSGKPCSAQQIETVSAAIRARYILKQMKGAPFEPALLSK